MFDWFLVVVLFCLHRPARSVIPLVPGRRLVGATCSHQTFCYYSLESLQLYSVSISLSMSALPDADLYLRARLPPTREEYDIRSDRVRGMEGTETVRLDIAKTHPKLEQKETYYVGVFCDEANATCVYDLLLQTELFVKGFAWAVIDQYLSSSSSRCPKNCTSSQHGTCADNICHCSATWVLDDCSGPFSVASLGSQPQKFSFPKQHYFLLEVGSDVTRDLEVSITLESLSYIGVMFSHDKFPTATDFEYRRVVPSVVKLSMELAPDFYQRAGGKVYMMIQNEDYPIGKLEGTMVISEQPEQPTAKETAVTFLVLFVVLAVVNLVVVVLVVIGCVTGCVVWRVRVRDEQKRAIGPIGQELPQSLYDPLVDDADGGAASVSEKQPMVVNVGEGEEG